MFKKYFYYTVLATLAASNVTALPNTCDETLLMQSEIKHVVILMLENRSFDNVLGWLYDKDDQLKFIPANTDPVFLGLSEDTLDQYTNTLKNSAGEVVFTCPPIKGLPSVEGSKLINSPKFDPNEPFDSVTTQVFGIDGSIEPTMNGFLQDFATLWDEKEWVKQKTDICAVMETYTAKELPVFYGLAKHYAVSDLWFSSVPTQTNPNRAFSMCGTSEGEIINGPLGKNDFQSDTIWNRFTEEASDATWMVYWQGDMIPGLYPGPYSGTNTFASMARIPDVDSHFLTIDKFHEHARKGQLPAVSFIEPQWTLSQNLSPDEKELDDLLCKYEDLVLGVQGNDLHPPGEVRTGENLLANIYTSLIANLAAWEHTLLIITFDEHGGLFDHVVPPAAIPPDDCCQHGFGFDRYGVRIATLFISPKIDKGVIIRSDDPSIPFDHTSTLATLLKWRGIDKSNWRLGKRVDAAPTFENVITRTESRTDYVLAEDTEILPEVDAHNVVTMGDTFYLKNKKGKYLTRIKHLVQKEKVPLQFIGGEGKITHGSFCLIKANDPSLGHKNLLETSLNRYNCIYAANTHSPGQWWTVKSVDHPYVGAEIQYGDRIYLENHIYLDVLQYVPGRLVQISNLFTTFLTTKPISDESSDDNYWFVVRE